MHNLLILPTFFPHGGGEGKLPIGSCWLMVVLTDVAPFGRCSLMVALVKLFVILEHQHLHQLPTVWWWQLTFPYW